MPTARPSAVSVVAFEASLAERLGVGELGDAEVEDLDPPVLRQEEVGGLEVAVDDAVLVRGGEAAGDLLGVLDGLAERQRAGGEHLAERAALEELGDEVGGAVVGADVEEGEDVGVVEGAGEAGLLLEAAEAVGVLAVLGGEDLDGDVAVEAGVAGAVDLAHPAGPDRAPDLVRPQPRPGRERHGHPDGSTE